MQLKVGDQVTRSPREEPWTVDVVYDRDVWLVRGGHRKGLKRGTIASIYHMVSSERFKKLVADFKRRDWPVWEGYLKEEGNGQVRSDCNH